MPKSSEKQVWCVKVYLHATEDEAAEISERLGAAICPDPFHAGYCPVPWGTETVRPSGKEARSWEQHFKEERAAAEAAGDLPPPHTGP